MIRRTLLLIGIFLAGITAILVYLEDRAADRAARLSPSGGSPAAGRERIWNPLPLNDRAFHERAKAAFERGVNRLGEPDLRDADFRLAHRYFIRSLVLNPFSPRAHFDFAQALQYLNALDFPFPERYFDEYRKAAVLSGVDHSVYAEVGRILLSRWDSLSPDERLFAGRIVRRLLSDGNQDRENRLDAFLRLWELNIGDPKVLETILPAEAGACRRAARFLGEKSLDPAARLGFLVRAEILDFEEAGKDARAAENEFRTRRISGASEHFQSAKRRLDGILFFQDVAHQAGIDPDEFKTLMKTVQLGIVKCGIEASGKLADIVADLQTYLADADGPAAVAELEKLLKERRLIDDQFRSGFQDFTRFSFKMALSYRQNRFREVVQAGYSLDQSLLIAPGNRKEQYGRLFEIVGDACQKLDDLYESNAFYEKAAALGVTDVGLRLKMKRNYERLNDDKALKEIEAIIREELTPRETSLEGLDLKPGEPYDLTLALEEKKYRMTMVFSGYSENPPPWISISFNGRAVREAVLSGPALEVDLPAVMGMNRLRLTAVNRVFYPVRMILVAETDQGETIPGRRLPL